MRRTLLALALFLPFLAACEAGPGGPTVLQGHVVRYDAERKLLEVRDEKPPGGVTELSLSGAEIGAEPAPGDLVRVAYRVVEGRAVAGRVMNLTKQADFGKGAKGGGGH